MNLVYCTNCGTKNDDNNEFCVNCKESLINTQTIKRERRQKESECFGLPYGGSIIGLVIGLIIVIWGISSVMGINFGSFLWPIVIIIFGILMIAGALYTMNRRR